MKPNPFTLLPRRTSDSYIPDRHDTVLFPCSSFVCPPRRAKQLSKPNVDLSFDHIYYLEKRDLVLPPPPEPVLGPHGWVYPPHPPSPVPRIIGRTTALRLRSGEFVQHRIGLMKRTQSYAKRSNVPVDNLVTFSVSVGGLWAAGRAAPAVGGAVDASVWLDACCFSSRGVCVCVSACVRACLLAFPTPLFVCQSER